MRRAQILAHLFTAAVVVKSALLGSGPVGAVTTVVSEHPEFAKEVVTGSAQGFWTKLTSRWQSTQSKQPNQTASQGMKQP